jgi:hypothetical protein
VWPDNETGIDLLGFDVLVDELVVVLTDGRLLPLTVGVLGGWGSGKSSLLKQAHGELAEGGTDSPYVRIDFSPWKYEDYEDVKAALMRAVLDARQARAAGDDDRVKEIGALRRFVRNFGRRSRAVGRLAVAAAPAVAPGVLAAMDPHAVQTNARPVASRPASGPTSPPGSSKDSVSCAGVKPSASSTQPTRGDFGNDVRTTISRA